MNHYHTRPAEELYNVIDDPSELKYLAVDSKHSERLKTLRADLDVWMKANGDDGLATEKALPDPRANRK